MNLMTQTTRRIHPLMAGAAVSVTLVSLLGAAAITGVLPTSHAFSADTSLPQAHTHVVPVQPVAAVRRSAPVYAQSQPQTQIQTQPQTQQTQSQPPRPQPVAVARNSPLGIGVGAVIGGVLGNQVGSGDGKTLATIAGAIGGGYIGNEVAKRNQ